MSESCCYPTPTPDGGFEYKPCKKEGCPAWNVEKGYCKE